MSCIAPTLQAFFTDRSDHPTQQQPRDDRLLPRHHAPAARLRSRADRQTALPARLRDLDAPLIGSVSHPPGDRSRQQHRTRNNRLAAIHSFFRYAALEHPEHAQTIARVMAIPTKRYQRKDISYLEPGRDQGATHGARTEAAGSAGAITRCFSPSSKPAYAFQNSPTSE